MGLDQYWYSHKKSLLSVIEDIEEQMTKEELETVHSTENPSIIQRAYLHAKDQKDKGREEIAYCRKNWALQNWFNSSNCEDVVVTEKMLDELEKVYEDFEYNNEYELNETRQAIISARRELKDGNMVIYHGWW